MKLYIPIKRFKNGKNGKLDPYVAVVYPEPEYVFRVLAENNELNTYDVAELDVDRFSVTNILKSEKSDYWESEEE